MVVGVLAVLAIIIIVYYATKNPAMFRKEYWLANYVENPWAVYSRSAGTFDDAARLALDRATGRAAPTPGDHALAATIIARNIIGQEHRPEFGADGAPTPAAVAEARRRQEMMGMAQAHYLAAVVGLRRAGLDAPAAANTRLAAAAGGGRAPPGATFIIDLADEFAHEGMLAFAENDPLFWLLNLGQLPGEPIDIDTILANATQETRGVTIAERQAAAKAAARDSVNARQEAAAEYVRLATANTDDPQNTHDSGVLACLRGIVTRLRADQAGATLPTLDEIKTAIANQGAKLSDSRPYRVADVNAVIDRASLGERIVKLDVTDEECLRRVWLRASDPRNDAHKANIEQAVFDALFDCWESGVGARHIVCVNGRTSRILSALVTLDWDRRNWVIKKLEQFKNDIFARSRTVIEAVARTAAAAADPETRSAGAAYLATTTAELAAAGEVSPAAGSALAGQMRAAVENMVDEYISELEAQGIDAAIPTYMVDAVKAEARAAVTE